MALFFGQLKVIVIGAVAIAVFFIQGSGLQQVGLGASEPLHAGGCEPQTTPGDLRGAVFLPVQPLSESELPVSVSASGIGCTVWMRR